MTYFCVKEQTLQDCVIIFEIAIVFCDLRDKFLCCKKAFFPRFICGKNVFKMPFELVVNFIIEFYRPRSLGESRPVFESQLLSLFTEPGGVLRNIASALDY